MIRITLEQWRMFKAVVDYGGFSQASNEVHKSQSSIHSAVSKIESTLNVKLFVIDGRRTTLTDAGRALLRRVNFLLDEASKVEHTGELLGTGIETRLKIAVDEVFPKNFLFAALENVSVEYPHLCIELTESVLSGAYELLDSAAVDIAVSPVVFNSEYSEELCEIEFIAVASPLHPLTKMAQALDLEDLKSHRQIVVRDSSSDHSADDGWLKADQRWTVSHMSTSVDIIKSGLGFAWLPKCLIENELKEGLLKQLNLHSNASRKVKLYLLFNDADNLGEASRSFLAQLRLQTMHL